MQGGGAPLSSGAIAKLERWLDRLRAQRWVLLVALLALLALTVVATIGLMLAGEKDLANVVLAIAVLVVAVATLLVAVPVPARLHFEKEDRPGSPDLIFFLWSSPGPASVQWPRDFTLNIDVVVINVGGRKTVLSYLGLVEFLGPTGERIVPHTMPTPLYATLIRQRRGFVSTGGVGGLHFQTDQDPGPFVIAPDEAITLRVRWRGGIDWTTRWNLQETGVLGRSLEHPITKARIEAAYRRGTEKVKEEFVLPVSVEQQELYQEQLRSLTRDFTTMPSQVPVQHLRFTTGIFE